MHSRVKNIKIASSSSILQALQKMDNEGVKSLLAFRKEAFLGLITIGDIQRAIIRNIDISSPITAIVDKNKIYAGLNDDLETIKNRMYRLKAECMPVVSENGELADVYFWKDLLAIQQIQQREKINLPVVIMAGGLGTRMKPLTNIIPKPLIPLNDKTIVELIMDQFRDIGCEKFYMSVNYKFELLKYYIDSLDTKYSVEFFKEEKPLGTIGSVSLLKNKLKTPFFVSNCDIIIDQDYRDVYDYHVENDNQITIVAALKSYRIPYGVVETGDNGSLISMSEKPEITYLANTGIYVLNPELVMDIPENHFFHITELIEQTKNKGGKVGCFPVSEKSWTDIGDWNEYLKYINLK